MEDNKAPLAEDAIANTNTGLALYGVVSVTAANEPEVYVLVIDCIDAMGIRGLLNYVSRPDDPYGLNPAIRQWLIDHEGEYEILPYVPPPPQPYSFDVASLWNRVTDDEADSFDAAIATAPPLRLRKQFNLTSSMMSDSELFVWTKNVLLTVTTAARADIIMGQ